MWRANILHVNKGEKRTWRDKKKATLKPKNNIL
jgi:hypothetical protein